MAVLLGAGVGAALGDGTTAPAPPINLAAFGRLAFLESTNATRRLDVSVLGAGTNTQALPMLPGAAIEIEWDHPRPVRAVTVTCEPPALQPEDLTVQWWRRIWPDNGTGGWMKLDDPFNGQWTTVRANGTTNANELRFDFAPLDAAEAPGVQRQGMPERSTYKLRLLPKRACRMRQVAVFSDAVARQARLRFEWNLKAGNAVPAAPAFEARNGRLVQTRRPGRDSAVVEVAYADAPDRLSPDRGFVVFRRGATGSFAVFVDDVLREGGLWVRDLGVFVSDADQALTFRTWPGPTGEVWKEGTIAEQVARMPEQSYEAASRSLPEKPPAYLFLGVPNLRQEIALLPQGQIQLRADSLRSPGPDADLRPWKWADLVYDFGTGEHPTMGPNRPRAVQRNLAEGWLPVVRHEWQTDDIRYVEICLAAPLTADLRTLQSRTGTEPVVLATRFELRNTAAQPRTAWLWLELSHTAPLQLGVDNTLLLRRSSDDSDRPGLVPVRGRFDLRGKGALDLAVLAPDAPGSFNSAYANSREARDAVRYRVDLAPGETHALDLFVPYLELLDANEAAALKRLTFTNLQASVVRFWEERVAQGMTYEVPEPFLNHLFKANLWHVLISTDLDPTTGFQQHGAATHSYGNFLNETAMVARSLEMRGEADAALALLEPFLACQSVKGLPGNFATQEGVLYAAHPTEPDPYTAQGYNMHHGWGLWAAAEHGFWTRDGEYLMRVIPQLALAADWITRERQATRLPNLDGSRRIEHGLAPAGDLEDVAEYLYFYATDAYYHLGIRTVADALAALVQAARRVRATADPVADAAARSLVADLTALARRLDRDAVAFRQDILASLAESVATSPVVRLRDGSYVPFVPPRVHALTHRKEGWIREGLYPALHLVNGGVLDARHPFVDWMIQDLEDNIFLSAESGYGVAEARRDFFDLGGFTLQPNLLDLPWVYLQRDQIPNFLRAFYNTARASLYPDVMCFAEWVPAYGQGGGPLYKTPDECKFIQWMRQMLVLERSGALELGLGVPRAWMSDGKRIRLERAATMHGKLDLEIVSHAAEHWIVATATLTPTELPNAVRLRLRHPEGRPIRTAEVNGKPAKITADRQLIELPVTTNRWQVVASF